MMLKKGIKETNIIFHYTGSFDSSDKTPLYLSVLGNHTYTVILIGYVWVVHQMTHSHKEQGTPTKKGSDDFLGH